MTAAAARLHDPISHTSAMGGLLTGLAIGAGVALAGIAIAGTGGLAAVAIVGASASAGAGIGQVIGSLSGFTNESGMISSASPNVRINGVPAARAHADYVDCSKHDHGRKVIAEGSVGVRINGYPAARVGDRTACDGKISSGSSNVRIGGKTVQTDEINPEVPVWLEWTIAGVGIASALVLASPAVVTLGLLGG
ncbi:MAG: PAAR domain-containing protein, partial [Salinicola sp.]